MLGATGTIGKATHQELRTRGHEVESFGRAQGDVTDAASIERWGFADKKIDAIVSCMASRTGAPRDAWAIDHHAHSVALQVAKKHLLRKFCHYSKLRFVHSFMLKIPPASS